jgi:hypothetical protein
MSQFCVLSTNTNLEAVAWGPFNTLKKAKNAHKALERGFPRAKHIILPFQDMNDIPKREENIKNAEKRPPNTSGETSKGENHSTASEDDS